MASRFWVGGTGTWDGSDTTHWSASSGGAAGASAPTATDDVFLDGSSGAGTISMAAAARAQNLDCTGYTGTLTLTGAPTLTPTTTIKFASGMTFNGSANFQINPTAGSSVAFTSAGITLTNSILLAGSATSTVTLQDNTTISGEWRVTSGSFVTNNKNLTCGTFTSSNSNTRAITLGSSTVTITSAPGSTSYAWDTTTTTNLTFTAGTSTILFSGTNGIQLVNFGSLTYNNVQRVPSAGTGVDEFCLNSNLTCAGTFTATADNANTHRLIIRGVNTANSNTTGTQRTISAAAVSLTNVDFQDIAGSGAATWSGTSLGDGQGNSGITFATPRTLYGVVAGNWSSSSVWSLSSGGAGGQAAPLLHDTVILDASSAAGTYTIDLARPCADLTCTGFTRTLSGAGTVQWFGSITLGSGMTFTITGSNTMCGRGARTVTMAGKSWGGVTQLNAPTGTYTLQDNFTVTGASIRIVNGTLAANGKTITAPTFLAQVGPVATPPTLDLGSGGSLVLNGTGTVINVTVVIQVTGGGIIDTTDTSGTAKTWALGNNNCYGCTLRHSATGAAGLTITGNAVVSTMDLECTTARTVTLPASGILNIGNLILQGANGQNLSVVSSSPGTTLRIRYQYKTETFDSPSADILFTQVRPGIKLGGMKGI